MVYRYGMTFHGSRCTVCGNLYNGVMLCPKEAPFCSLACQEKAQRQVEANYRKLKKW